MAKKKAKKNKKERRIEKELLGIIAFVVFLVILFVAVSAVFRSFNSFEYEGLTFTNEKLGEIPVFHYYYYFVREGRLTQYNLYVRNDPRTNDIPIMGDEISFGDRSPGEIVYVSVDSVGLQQCEQGVLAVADLTRFLDDNRIEVEGANLDFWEAGRKGQEWVTCNSEPDNIVIELNSVSEDTEIFITGNCHRINVANCEVLEAVEKYKVQAVIDAK